jgi:hypothetical protein
MATKEELENFYRENRIRQAQSVAPTVFDDPANAPTFFGSSLPVNQVARNLQVYGGSRLEPYEPTMRENIRTAISDAGQYLGLPQRTSQRLAKGFMGNPSAENFSQQIGLLDLAPVVNIPFYLQEAKRGFDRAQTGSDYIGPALEGGFALLEGALVTKPIAKTLKPFATSLAKKLQGETTNVATKQEVGALPKVIANTKLQAPSMAMVNPRKIDDLGFYYKSEELANTMKQNKGSGSDFQNFFLGKGITKAELDDTGLEELFKQDNVTKDDIRKTISLNKIKLSENIYQDDDLGITEGGALIFEDISKKISETPLYNQYSKNEINFNIGTRTREDALRQDPVIMSEYEKRIPTTVLEDTKTGYRIVYDDKGGYFLTFKKDADIFNIEESEQAKALIEMGDDIDDMRFNEIAGYGSKAEARLQTEGFAINNQDYKTLKPRFESETQEGGTNYKEYVLKRPSLQNKGKPTNFDYSDDVDFQRAVHYDDYNPIFHVRTKDRIGEDGSKILYVEELQSDWGQIGRNKGFAPPKSGGSYQKKPIQKVQKNLDKLMDEVLSFKDQLIQLNKAESEILFKTKNPGRVNALFPNYADEFRIMKMSDYLDFTRTPEYKNNIPKELQADYAYPEISGFMNPERKIYEDSKKIEFDTRFADMNEDQQKDFILNFGLRSLGNDQYYMSGNNRFTNINELSDHLDILNNKVDANVELIRGTTPAAAFVTDTKDWTKLGIKRLLQLATEGGYDKIAISPGNVQADRWMNDDLIPYYDNIIPSVAKDVVGEKNIGKTKINIGGEKNYFVRQLDDNTYQAMLETTEDMGGEDFGDLVGVPIESFRDAYTAQNYVNKKNSGYIQDTMTIDVTPEIKDRVSKGLSLFTIGAGTTLGLEGQIGALGSMPSTQDGGT